MTKLSKSEIMKNAWIMAGNAAFLHGGKKSEYFAECLKQEWAFRKMLANASKVQAKKAERVAKSVDEIESIKPWFIRKNFDANQAYAIETNDWIEVVEETAKAYKLVVHNAKFGNIRTWAPKSCCIA